MGNLMLRILCSAILVLASSTVFAADLTAPVECKLHKAPGAIAEKTSGVGPGTPNVFLFKARKEIPVVKEGPGAKAVLSTITPKGVVVKFCSAEGRELADVAFRSPNGNTLSTWMSVADIQLIRTDRKTWGGALDEAFGDTGFKTSGLPWFQ